MEIAGEPEGPKKAPRNFNGRAAFLVWIKEKTVQNEEVALQKNEEVTPQMESEQEAFRFPAPKQSYDLKTATCQDRKAKTNMCGLLPSVETPDRTDFVRHSRRFQLGNLAQNGTTSDSGRIEL